jgi:uncharacterized protein DUF6473
VNIELVGKMSFELPGAGVPEDLLCQYGTSKVMCRGPSRSLKEPYVAFLGGSETFGRFVDQPFVAQVEQALGWSCVNLGSANAGLDAYVQDPDLLRIAGDARLTVVQVMGAQNLSNKYYRVHPRRNDRFLAPSSLLASIYGDVDFTEFHFNKHLLNTLNFESTRRFQVVVSELQDIWLARMRLLLGAFPKKPLLLWLRYQPEGNEALGTEPLLIDPSLLDRLSPDIEGVVEVAVERTGGSEELDRMRFGPMQAPAASNMIGPATHRLIATRVTAALRNIL